MRDLITTAIEENWPENEKVVFLGEWCRRYDRKDRWLKLDAEMLPYHWDDRAKLERDYAGISALYEELLACLATELNGIHGVTHSVLYWRILAGPWLGYFLQILFDRWAMIERAVNSGLVARARCSSTTNPGLVPNDMDEFQTMFAGDEWNDLIYGQLVAGWTKLDLLETGARVGGSAARASSSLPKRIARRAVSTAQGAFTQADEAFFIAPYLPAGQDFRLQLRFGQLPKVWRSHPAPQTAPDWGRRTFHLDGAPGSEFETIARAMIPRHLPTSYLEGYPALVAGCAALPWPKRPRLIFTSNAYSSDDVFKCWAAGKVEAGSPLAIGQHGGNYGMARWTFTEDHQRAISHRWLSWGWSDGRKGTVVPVGNLKMLGRSLGWNPEGGALLVENIIPRYSYHMYSIPVAGQWVRYFEDQVRFVNALPAKLREQTIVRLYNQDYGWNAAQRWADLMPSVRLERGEAKIEALIESSRVTISSWNSTTLLETLGMNVPTIMFWNPDHWELREEAVPYFEMLRAAGIFHDTPESAAAKVSEIWSDVGAWWNGDKVQEARIAFSDRFSRCVANPVDELTRALDFSRPTGSDRPH